jgi:hypothetical protein
MLPHRVPDRRFDGRYLLSGERSAWVLRTRAGSALRLTEPTSATAFGRPGDRALGPWHGRVSSDLRPLQCCTNPPGIAIAHPLRVTRTLTPASWPIRRIHVCSWPFALVRRVVDLPFSFADVRRIRLDDSPKLRFANPPRPVWSLRGRSPCHGV